MLHKEILTKEQLALLPLAKKVGKEFILVGGTAIALHLGHRESIDFDFFSPKKFKNERLKNMILKRRNIDKTYINAPGEYTLMINKVKFTFFEFPYEIKAVDSLEDIIKIPDLLTLAAMKVFALGFRGKWKDYVDLYFILKDHYSLADISKKAKEIFKGEFNARILREQLTYFDDVSYYEKVVYLKGFAVSDETVKKGLRKFSVA